MTFQGLDPDAVDALGARLRQQAEQLALLTQRVDVLVTRAGDVWGGYDSAEFAGWWYQQHRPAAMGAAESLRQLAESARSNAEQQRAASSGGGHVGETTSRPRHDGGVDAWRRLLDTGRAALPWLERGAGVLAVSSALTSNAGVVGRYTNRWRTAIDVLGDFARYKRSPVLQWAHGNGPLRAVGGLGRALDASPLGNTLGVVGVVGSVVEHVPEMHRRWTAGDELGAATEAGHLAADALKQSKHPVFYLGGMAVETVTLNVEMAREIDWSEGLPNPLADDNLTKIYLPALGDSIKQFGTRTFWQIAT